MIFQKITSFTVETSTKLITLCRGRDSSVGIATRYWLDGPRIESRWKARFSAPVQTDPGSPPSLQYNIYRGFPGEKAAGAWFRPPTPQSSASGPSWPALV